MSRKKRSRPAPPRDEAPLSWGQNVAAMAAAGALIGGSFAILMLLGVRRNSPPLIEQLKVSVWEAVVLHVIGGAVIGVVAGVIHPMTRFGLIAQLAFGAIVGAMISVPLGIMLDELSLTTTAVTAGLGLFATAGSAFQDWMKRPRS